VDCRFIRQAGEDGLGRDALEVEESKIHGGRVTISIPKAT